MQLRVLFVVGVWISLHGLFPAGAAESEEFGPFYSQHSLTLTAGERAEALGPLLSLEHKDLETTWVLSPLLSNRRDKGTDSDEWDFFFPLVTYDRFGLDYRWQFLQLFSFSGGQNVDSNRTHRLTLFPFYFHQRSDNPDKNYTAVLPFYGTLKNRFFRDEIRFFMFPAYMQTRKRDVVTDNYLMPFFDLRHGDGLKGWQFWPLVGQEHKEVTTRTNQYDEVELIGGHDKLFVLWPIFFKNDLGIGTTNAQKQRLLLPFYSIQRSPARDSTSLLWPLGYTYTEDREKKYREWALPWPIVDFARGEGKTINRVWPLFSRARTAHLQSDFYLWPIYKYNRVTAPPVDRERVRLLFFLYSDLIERNTTTQTSRRRTDLWPLFTARRDHNGNERLQILAPLEPLLPNSTAIERNYSPLWSLWRSEKNGTTGATSQSLLWNLYRRETQPGARKCSLLFGLFRYQSGPEGKQWRLFYVPLGKHGRPVEPSSATS